jgi:hypothetical protein
MKYTLQRWSGSVWYDTMLSPFNSMAEMHKHLKDYWWHYTNNNPYRIKDYKPKNKIQKYSPKYDWNSDRGMALQKY